MNANSKIVDKITKLLALATGKGTTPAESATAAAQAQRLMLKHNIAQADVDEHDVDTTPDEAIGSGTLWEGGRVIGWVLDLAAGLARLNCCRVLIRAATRIDSKGYGGDNQPNEPARITVIGTESNAMIVRYLLTYLMREIDRLAKETSRDDAFNAGASVKAYRNAFRKGAAAEVLKRLRWEQREQRQEIRDTGARASTALVRVDEHDARVQAFTDKRSGGGSYMGGGDVGSRSGAQAGRAAGRGISVNRGLSAGGKTGGSKLLN